MFRHIKILAVVLSTLFFSTLLADATYDSSSRSPGTDFFVYEGQSKTLPTASTSPSSAIVDYSPLNSIGGSTHSYSVPSNAYFAQLRFELTLDEVAATLTQLNVNWQGTAENSHSARDDGASLYIWNYSTSSYELLASSLSSGNITLSGSITASIVNYMGGAGLNTLTFLVMSADKKTANRDNILTTDYFSVGTIDGAPAADHLTLTLSNLGLYCLPHSITATVYDSLNSVLTSYDQQITLDSQSGNGTWSLLTGNGTFTDATADDGLATYVYATADNGVATFNLSYQQGSTPINIDMYQSTDTAIRDDDTEGDVAFSPSGFVITESALSNPPPNPINTLISSQTAGTTFPLYITAYGQTATDPVCGVIENYTGNKNIYFWSDYSNPSSGTLTPTVDTLSIAATEGAAVNQSVIFTAGQASIGVKYKDVGAIIVNAKDIDPSGNIVGATPAFVVRPADFLLTVTANPAAADSVGAVFRKAGEPFEVIVQVVDSEGDTTPNYGNETIAEGISISSTSLVAPVGGRNGVLNNGAITNGSAFTALSPGVFSGNSFAFDEVGIIRLSAEIADLDYLASGNVTGTETGNVGRFTPWRLLVTDNAPILFRDGLSPWACSMTYQGQAFGYGAGLDPEFTITAQNSAGVATFNYGGDFWKLATDLSDRTYSNNAVAINAILGFDLTAAMITLSATADLTDGQGLLTINNEQLTYSKASVTATSGDQSFAADIDLLLTALSLTDSDGICSDADNNGSCDSYILSGITGTDIHYGRLAMDNGYGSELSSLAIEVRVETWNGSAFVTHSADSCTDELTDWTGFLLSNYTGNLSAGETAASFAGLDPILTPGSGLLTLSAPGIGNDGTVRITLTGPAWMQYDYDGDGAAEHVRAVANFGIWAGRAPIILIRESYR